MKKQERIFLDAMKHADRRYFTELSGRLRNPAAFTAAQKGRAFDMEKHEKKRRITKFAVGALIAAAVLGGGGMAAMVAMRGANGGTHYDRSDIDSFLQSRSESSETKSKSLGLNLTDTEWCDINATTTWSSYGEWFLPTEGGMLHETDFCLLDNGTSGKTEDEVVRKFREQYPCPYDTIRYYSEEDDTDVVLCAKSNCLHDGNEFCEASAMNPRRGQPAYYDGTLYFGAYDANAKTCGLYSYAMTGTGIEQLAVFAKAPAQAKDIVIHRGYVFCLFQVWEPDSGTDFDPQTSDWGDVRRGFAIYGYEITTGKTVELLYCVPGADINRTAEECPQGLTAGGDWLYFPGGGKWPTTYRDGLYGINLLTGEVKSVLSKTASVGRQYLVYYEETQRETYALHVYNTETGEDTDCGKQPYGITVTDGRYICIVQRKNYGGTPEKPTHFIVHVYDMQMHELGSVESPPHYQLADNTFLMQGGRIYIAASGSVQELTEQNGDDIIYHFTDPDTKVRSWSIDEIIAGTATPESWQTHCTTLRLITDEMLFSEE